MESINYNRLGKYKRLFVLDCIKPRIRYLNRALTGNVNMCAQRDCNDLIDFYKGSASPNDVNKRIHYESHGEFRKTYVSNFNDLEFKKGAYPKDDSIIGAKLILMSVDLATRDYFDFSPIKCIYLLNGAVGLLYPSSWNAGYSDVREQQNNIYKKYVRKNQNSTTVSEVNESHVLSVRRRMFFEEDK